MSQSSYYQNQNNRLDEIRTYPSIPNSINIMNFNNQISNQNKNVNVKKGKLFYNLFNQKKQESSINKPINKSFNHNTNTNSTGFINKNQHLYQRPRTRQKQNMETNKYYWNHRYQYDKQNINAYNQRQDSHFQDYIDSSSRNFTFRHIDSKIKANQYSLLQNNPFLHDQQQQQQQDIQLFTKLKFQKQFNKNIRLQQGIIMPNESSRSTPILHKLKSFQPLHKKQRQGFDPTNIYVSKQSPSKQSRQQFSLSEFQMRKLHQLKLEKVNYIVNQYQRAKRQIKESLSDVKKGLNYEIMEIITMSFTPNSQLNQQQVNKINPKSLQSTTEFWEKSGSNRFGLEDSDLINNLKTKQFQTTMNRTRGQSNLQKRESTIKILQSPGNNLNTFNSFQNSLASKEKSSKQKKQEGKDGKNIQVVEFTLGNISSKQNSPSSIHLLQDITDSNQKSKYQEIQSQELEENFTDRERDDINMIESINKFSSMNKNKGKRQKYKIDDMIELSLDEEVSSSGKNNSENSDEGNKGSSNKLRSEQRRKNIVISFKLPKGKAIKNRVMGGSKNGC